MTAKDLPKPIQNAYRGKKLTKIRGGTSSITEWYSFNVDDSPYRHLWLYDQRWVRAR